MDSFERVFNALNNRYVDRPPIFPQIGDHAGIISGLTYDLMYKDEKKAAEAHLKALDLYNYDFISIQVEPSWPVAEACGAEVIYPKDKNPWITNSLIETKADLNKLNVPDFIATQSSKVLIDGTKILVEKAHVPVVSYMSGPITFGLQLMPYNKVIVNMIRNPDLIHQLIKKAVEVIKSYVKILKKVGAQILVICEHDIQLIRPELVKEYSLDYLPEIFKIYDYNILHMCGKITPHLSMNAGVLRNLDRLNTLSIGQYVNITNTQELLNNDIGIAGNIDHIKLLPNGSPIDIEAAVHEAIRASEGDYRFMVAPECEITSDTPKENVKAFVNAVLSYQD